MSDPPRRVATSVVLSVETVDAIARYVETFARGPCRIAWHGRHVTIDVESKDDETLIRSMFPEIFAEGWPP